MKIFTLILLIISLNISCKRSNEQEFELNDFPKEWINLTNSSKGYIIYNDCEMGNLKISINNLNGKYQLLLHGTQEDDDFDILEVQQSNDTIKLNALRKGFNQTQIFSFIWIDKQKNIGKWVTTYSENENVVNYIVTESRFQKNYESVEQPCVECWNQTCQDYFLE